MNRINPAKLLHSKWTAVEPKNKEKHKSLFIEKLDKPCYVYRKNFLFYHRITDKNKVIYVFNP